MEEEVLKNLKKDAAKENISVEEFVMKVLERFINGKLRRKNGGDLGGRPKTSDKKEKLVIRLREDGDSYREIREQTGLG